MARILKEKWATVDETAEYQTNNKLKSGVDDISNNHRLVIRRDPNKEFTVYIGLNPIQTFKEFKDAQEFINNFDFNQSVD